MGRNASEFLARVPGMGKLFEVRREEKKLSQSEDMYNREIFYYTNLLLDLSFPPVDPSAEFAEYAEYEGYSIDRYVRVDSTLTPYARGMREESHSIQIARTVPRKTNKGWLFPQQAEKIVIRVGNHPLYEVAGGPIKDKAGFFDGTIIVSNVQPESYKTLGDVTKIAPNFVQLSRHREFVIALYNDMAREEIPPGLSQYGEVFHMGKQLQANGRVKV